VIVEKVVAQIMNIVTTTQRQLQGSTCAKRPCPRCTEIHEEKIRTRIAENLPIRFLLPAFPGKSPNPRKVLGVLPDKAEELALAFLDDLCQRVAECYPPGAEIIISSDGRVFSDVIGIRDEDVTAYQHVMHELADRIGPDTLRLYHLDEVYPDRDHDAMRTALLTSYGEDLADIRERVGDGGEALALYRGVTRFLFEDADRPDSTRSRRARQRDSRRRAYEVIRRSAAWSELLREIFPDAVRLSIHPQACGAQKIGIGLVDTDDDDNWLTPWHSTAVDVDGRFVLMPRHQAESLGAQLVHQNGRPSHFQLSVTRALAS
jgi:pyoverdine/dityrosine biosynthesis protein Dit1